MALLVAVVSVLTLVAAPVSAQSASTLRDELLKDWLDMQTTLNALASVMPEDRYSFKTTPPQRDFAQQILHVANANVVNLKFLGVSIQAPTIDRAARTKADVLRAMNASLTSTSTSSDDISTMVQMPVWVKPPTACGEIISPGWA